MKNIEAKIKHLLFILLFLHCAFFSFAEEKAVTIPASGKWVLQEESLSATKTINLVDTVNLAADTKHFTLTGDFSIPAELASGPVWFNPGRIDAAVDIYADGIYVGTKNQHSPDLFVFHVTETAYLLPATVTKDGNVKIEIKGEKTYKQIQIESNPYFCNTACINTVVTYKNLLNVRLYLVMAGLCIFLGLYILITFIFSPSDKSKLYYALSLLFISIYFYDMGCDTAPLGGLFFHAFARASLTGSTCYMLLFLMDRFKKKGLRVMKKIVPIFTAAVIGVFLFFYRDYAGQKNLFNVVLLPVFAILIYGLVVACKEIKHHNKASYPIMFGFIIGAGFGIHDIVYSVAGTYPFAWLQGFSFFAMNISVFISISMSSYILQKNVNDYSIELKEQKNQLSGILGNAEKMSSDMLKIAAQLDSEITTVAEAADRSVSDAKGITDSVQKQNQNLENTVIAVTDLVSSLKSVTDEINSFSANINSNTQQTDEVIQSFDTVRTGIEKAAAFSKNLTDVTKSSQSNISELTDIMGKIRKASAAISSITLVVNEFAEQTNLLAMNASIEAAHAGNAGKGFAVISQEIKKLATASSDQSKKIAEATQAISQSIEQGFTLSVEVKNSLEQIDAGADDTASRVQNAAAGTEQQQEAENKIAGSTKLLAESSEKIKQEASLQYEYAQNAQSNVKEISYSSRTVEKSAENILSANINLSQRTENLKQIAVKLRQSASEIASLITKTK